MEYLRNLIFLGRDKKKDTDIRGYDHGDSVMIKFFVMIKYIAKSVEIFCHD